MNLFYSQVWLLIIRCENLGSVPDLDQRWCWFTGVMICFSGVMTLVRFQIWVRGDVDMSQLVDNLGLALKFALCDLVCEYRLLTAPLCDVPEHYVRGIDSPLHSAPTSPAVSTKGKCPSPVRNTLGHTTTCYFILIMMLTYLHFKNLLSPLFFFF